VLIFLQLGAQWVFYTSITTNTWVMHCAAFFFFFGGTGVWTQGLIFTRQALLPLEHSASHFWGMRFFEMGSWELFAWGWFQTKILLISASQVARITGMSHQHPACIVLRCHQVTGFFSCIIILWDHPCMYDTPSLTNILLWHVTVFVSHTLYSSST
jgi:hypothetical protein